MSSHESTGQSAPRGARDPLPPMGRVGTFSPGIARIPHIAQLLGAERVVFLPLPVARGVDTIVGWGRKPNTKKARHYARAMGLPYAMLEDGFLRSVGLGATGAPPLSVVVDDVGIYYDATGPSRLERLLEEQSPDDPLDDGHLIGRAARAMDSIRRHRLSKYNAAPDWDPSSAPRGGRRRVLVVDQTEGDLSIRLGLPHPAGFQHMVEAALSENPDAEVWIKVHPNVLAGAKSGYLTQLAAQHRVRILREPVSPMSLLSEVDHVYVMTSLLGFEALVAGRSVTCFGVPFYAGWGLTDDRVPCTRRSRTRSLEQVFAAAYLLYARYLDPERGEPCDLERVMEHLALQRREHARTEGTFHCIGFSVWKRSFVPSFLASPRNDVRFVRGVSRAERGDPGVDPKLVIWGRREESDVHSLAERWGAPVWRMEDGFLRSVGLGSDLAAPASLVVDPLGIYYDPTKPSELERILASEQCTSDELARAARLRAAIVEHGISKYNVGVSAPETPPGEMPTALQVLVVGQVEDDASVKLGCPGIRTNAALLRAAREAHPGALVRYRPHPDVVTGNRRGHVSREVALDLADEVVTDVPLAVCLTKVDVVHTLTSLVGFEALLRGLRVVVHGQPFYAGWGLTEDREPHPRRTRVLSLDELVHGALIRYPRYVSPATGGYTTPEAVVEQLRRGRDVSDRSRRIHQSRTGRLFTKALNLIRTMRHAP